MRIAKPAALAAAAVLVGALFTIAAPVGPAAAASCHRTGAWSDFNGDGNDDLAITEPAAHGRVHVLYASAAGINADSPDDTLLTAGATTSGEYGETVVAGDFNDDGCTDLAVADPYATTDGATYGGNVTIFKGTPSGLTSTGVKLTIDNGGGTAHPGDYFGLGLATGDVNADGNDDLIVGTPNEDTIDVFLGTSNGLSTTGHPFVKGRNGVPGTPGSSGFGALGFGFALATGDFDGDGKADVAIGVPDETAAGHEAAGVVIILRGAANGTGLTTDGAQKWSQGTDGVPGVAEDGDQFGSSLATGDFRGNGRIDLAVGVPNETINGKANAGAVNILYSGGSAGLGTGGAQVFDENSSQMPGPAAVDDFFGQALAVGQYNLDNDHDLAIGVPGRSINGHDFAGAVDVIYGGTGTGLNAGGTTQLSQATPGVGGSADVGDGFGSSLANVYSPSVYGSQLVVGSPDETLGAKDQAGMVTIIHRNGDGLTGDGAQMFTEGTAGVKGTSCAECHFGYGVA